MTNAMANQAEVNFHIHLLEELANEVINQNLPHTEKHWGKDREAHHDESSTHENYRKYRNRRERGYIEIVTKD